MRLSVLYDGHVRLAWDVGHRDGVELDRSSVEGRHQRGWQADGLERRLLLPSGDELHFGDGDGVDPRLDHFPSSVEDGRRVEEPSRLEALWIVLLQRPDERRDLRGLARRRVLSVGFVLRWAIQRSEK